MNTSREHWAAWAGPEVEGRLRGTPSLFFAECDEEAYPHAVGILRVDERHCLLGTSFLRAHGWQCAEERCEAGRMTTVEVDQDLLVAMPPSVAQHAVIILRLAVSQRMALTLKPSDMVRLDFGHLDVAIATYEAFQRCVPTQYEVDEPKLFNKGAP